jgi:hypothetical protein
MQPLAHPRGHNSVTRQDIQDIKPQISKIRTIRRRSLATEEEMLEAAPAEFYPGAPPSSSWWRPGDANLAIRSRTELMQWQGVSRHRVTARKVAREETQEGVHERSRKLQQWHTGGAHGKRATERVEMHGRARPTPTAASRDVVRSGVGSEAALPGDRRL